MNILFAINFAGKSGTERYVANLERIFSEEGDKCFLAYNTAGMLVETMQQRGVACLQLDLTKADMTGSAKKLAAYCKEHAIDVIHAQYPVENIIAIKSLKYYDKPKVVFTDHIDRRQGFKWQILNRIYTPKNHAVISVCDEGVENLAADGISRSKIKLIYNGMVPNAEFRPQPASEPFKMIVAVRYVREKGLDFLLEIMAALREKTEKKFVCTVVGDGAEFENIKKSIAEMGLGDIVLQAGYRTDTKELMQASNLYINTSRVEAMSMAVLEAMNESLPIVASDASGNKALVEDDIVCGRVIKFGDAEGFAAAVLEYMKDRELLEAHSKAAFEKVHAKFDLRKLARETRAAYE